MHVYARELTDTEIHIHKMVIDTQIDKLPFMHAQNLN